MKIELLSDEEARKAIIDYIRKLHAAPTIAHLKRKGLVKNNRQFYRLFPGIGEACEEGGVPAPVVRLGTVKAALAKRKELKSTTQVQVPTRAQQGTSTTNPAFREVLAAEGEVAKLQESLDIAQRMERVKHKKAGLERQIYALEDKDVAKKMLHDKAEYTNGMQRCYDDHPNLQTQVTGLFSRTGRAAEIDKNLNTLITERFELVNANARIFPDVYNRAAEMPTGDSFACDEWNDIVEELKSGADIEDYLRFDATLATLRHGLCLSHGTRLTHAGGYQFNCPRGHWQFYRCPRCGSPLNYDGVRFHCPACLRRLFGV